MKNRLIQTICLLFTIGIAFAQPKNDTGGSPASGISTTTLIIGLVVVVIVGYLLYSRSRKS